MHKMGSIILSFITLPIALVSLRFVHRAECGALTCGMISMAKQIEYQFAYRTSLWMISIRVLLFL